MMIRCLVFLFALWNTSLLAAVAAAPELPNRVLWAWQRNEDLRFIDPTEFGVAYLACHAALRGDAVILERRNNSLHVPPETAMVPTLRIDVDHRVPCTFSDEQREAIVTTLVHLSKLPHVKQVQIDFDALQTERPFYRDLLTTVHERLKPEQTVLIGQDFGTRKPTTKLSITSLASWCLFDDWISDLPVDESVPMMFSLGRDREKILSYFRSHGDFRAMRCWGSLGLSLEEPDVNQLMIPIVQQRKMPCRVYVFTKYAWTAKKVKAVHDMLDAK